MTSLGGSEIASATMSNFVVGDIKIVVGNFGLLLAIWNGVSNLIVWEEKLFLILWLVFFDHDAGFGQLWETIQIDWFVTLVKRLLKNINKV